MNLDIKNLTLTYDKLNALDGLSGEIDHWKSIVIIGPSGGGKSTLLRVLAGLESPKEGFVKIGETELVFEEEWLLEYRKNISIVFQAFNLFPHWTAMENICIPLVKVHKLTNEEASKRANQLLSRFGLNEHAHKLPAQLSGGQQQRIAIARAMATEPQLLLLDEPTSALDPQLTHEVLDMILELRENNTNLVLVTHEMTFAKKAADKILFISEGKLCEQGTPEEIFNKPKTQKMKDFLSVGIEE